MKTKSRLAVASITGIVIGSMLSIPFILSESLFSSDIIPIIVSSAMIGISIGVSDYTSFGIKYLEVITYPVVIGIGLTFSIEIIAAILATPIYYSIPLYFCMGIPWGISRALDGIIHGSISFILECGILQMVLFGILGSRYDHFSIIIILFTLISTTVSIISSWHR